MFGQKNKFVIYTAIFGGYDDLIEPPIIGGCDYICFTDDKNLKSSVYKIIYVKPGKLDSVRQARKIKILSNKYLPDYKYTIWIDSNLMLKNGLIIWVAKFYLLFYKFITLKHDVRDCIYDELGTCIELNKDDAQLMKKQVERYRKDNYPPNNGMVASCLIVRRNQNKEVIKFCNEWWGEVRDYSRRDQLSFNYVAWKYHFKYKKLNVSWQNSYMHKVIPHKKDIYGK